MGSRVIGKMTIWKNTFTPLLLLTVWLSTAKVASSNLVTLTTNPASNSKGDIVIKQEGFLSIICHRRKQDLDFLQLKKNHSDGVHALYENDFLSEPFQSSGSRYRITVNPTNTRLILRGVVGADSGVYQCQYTEIDGTNHFSNKINLLVGVPIVSLELIHYRNGQVVARSDGKIVLEEGKGDSLACRVRVDGSVYVPDVQIRLDDQQDVLGWFHREKERDDTSGSGALVRHNITHRWLYNMDDNILNATNKMLSCTGTMPRFEDNPFIDSALLEIRYAPRFDCESMKKSKDQQKMELTCHAHMNPGLEELTVSGGKKGVNFSISPDQPTLDGHLLNITTLDIEGHHYKVVLSIAEPALYDDCVVQIRNNVSSVSKTIQLGLHDEDEWTPDQENGFIAPRTERLVGEGRQLLASSKVMTLALMLSLALLQTI